MSHAKLDAKTLAGLVAGFTLAISAAAADKAAPKDVNLPSIKGRDELGVNSGIALGNKPQPEDSAKGHFSFVAIPVLNPSIGAGAGVAELYTFGSPAARSTLTVGGGKTDNGSWAVGGGGGLHFAEDRYRLAFMAVGGKVNAKYYGTGDDSIFANDPVDFSGKGRFASIKPEIRIAGRFYGGFQIQYMDADISTDLPIDVLPELKVPFEFVSLGPVVEYDSRNSSWWPTRGMHATADVLWYHLTTSIYTLNFDNRFHTFSVGSSFYFNLADNLVFAVEGGAGGASEHTPFFLKPSLSIRGFSTGEKLDAYKAEAQGELRWMMSRRFGLVAFGGIGSTGKDLGSLGGLSWGAGVGARFRFSVVDQSNVGLDVAKGNGDWKVYFRVGEAL